MIEMNGQYFSFLSETKKLVPIYYSTLLGHILLFDFQQDP